MVDRTLTPGRLNCSAATFWIADLLDGFPAAVAASSSEKESQFLSIGVILANFAITKSSSPLLGRL